MLTLFEAELVNCQHKCIMGTRKATHVLYQNETLLLTVSDLKIVEAMLMPNSVNTANLLVDLCC